MKNRARNTGLDSSRAVLLRFLTRAMADYCVILITVPDAKTADQISQTLVERNLAACVNQVPKVKSTYWWDGKIEKSEEILLLAKTRLVLTKDVAQVVKSLHPYTVCEVIALPLVWGHPPYLDWVGANTIFSKPPGDERRR